MYGATVIDHPPVRHKLTLMRYEISTLIRHEVTRDPALETVDIETPTGPLPAPKIPGKKPVFAWILRAGNGLLEGMLDLVPSARVAHIGLYRDHHTLEAIEYYFKVPEDIGERRVIVVDPMPATTNSAISRLKQAGAHSISFVSLPAVREGIERLSAARPDVPIFNAVIDPNPNNKGYIVPGPGDAGDRIYGTKQT